ncbi:MAG: lycopene beta-cyclase CrtY [Myxococcales bacterium]|nr:lycopene beta-cyclase CrtY [Myxococcales bacterium]
MNVFADYALVGGGLQNGLVALALRHARPDARVVMIERGATIGGNHTWCFHAGDVEAESAPWIDPLVAHRWDGYDVAFPAHARHLASPYACVTSERLAAAVTLALDTPGSQLLLDSTVIEAAADHVMVRAATGAITRIDATAVIDARGPDAGPRTACGWQKFLGQELVLERPHGLEHPMLMDATVPQLDGFRFLYVLPLAPDRLLVEDTYFSESTYLDVGMLRARIADYVAAHGWVPTQVAREEVGVIPLPWRYELPPLQAPLLAGYGGGWFHPVTGYSFPIAARLATFLAARGPGEVFGPPLEAFAVRHRSQLAFALRLNRMLYHWFAPEDRYHVLERFYRLPEDSIRRFYALETTRMDRARIVIGRPPRGLSLRHMLRGAAT